MTAWPPAFLFHLLSRQPVILLMCQRFTNLVEMGRLGFVGVALRLAGRRGWLGHHQITWRLGGLGLKLRLCCLDLLSRVRGLEGGKLLARDFFGLGDDRLLAGDLGDVSN